MPDQTTNKEGLSSDSKTPSSTDTKNQGTTEEKAEKGKEKKMGFFDKWRARTTEAYEKHRAAGGNF